MRRCPSSVGAFLVAVILLVSSVDGNIFSFFKRGWNRVKKMGQAVRMIQYDRAENERNAISALKMNGSALNWYKLDDPVMGGQSESDHVVEDGILNFKGTINTNGGGFASIRSKIGMDLAGIKGIRLRIRGDGKTYKFFLMSESGGGPMSRNPSWQFDVPTTGEWQDVEIPFDKLLPSFGPRAVSDPSQYKFDSSEMEIVGLMLSLKRADGSSNPKETFGEGIFPFSLKVETIQGIS